jgi:hypothetical protein
LSVTLLCPECHRTIVVSEPLPTACSQCSSALPATLVTAAEEQLRREFEAKPLLLRLLPIFLGLWAVIAVPLSITLLLSSGGTYTINGVQVTREEFMQRTGGVLIAFPVLGVLAGVIAWGLYRDYQWARPSTIAFFLAAALSPTLMFSRDRQLATPWSVTFLMTAVIAIPICWYFYGKRNVVRYYAGPAITR